MITSGWTQADMNLADDLKVLQVSAWLASLAQNGMKELQQPQIQCQ